MLCYMKDSYIRYENSTSQILYAGQVWTRNTKFVLPDSNLMNPRGMIGEFAILKRKWHEVFTIIGAWLRLRKSWGVHR